MSVEEVFKDISETKQQLNKDVEKLLKRPVPTVAAAWTVMLGIAFSLILIIGTSVLAVVARLEKHQTVVTVTFSTWPDNINMVHFKTTSNTSSIATEGVIYENPDGVLYLREDRAFSPPYTDDDMAVLVYRYVLHHYRKDDLLYVQCDDSGVNYDRLNGEFLAEFKDLIDLQ